MASEIKITNTIQATKDTFVLPKFGGSINVDMNVAGGGTPGILLATNATNGVNVPTTGLTLPGWIFMFNLDAAATVDFGMVDTGVIKILGRMKAGESALFRLSPGVTIAVKSSVASSKVQVIVLED